MMLAPDAARKPATAATIPWRSGQVISRRPFRSGPVALLVLLAGPAPARVVAADVVVLVDAPLLHDRGLVPGRLAGLAVGARLVLHRAAGVGQRAEAAGSLRRRLP